MYQKFELTVDPSNGPKRLALLRTALSEVGLDAFLIPRTDRYRGETVAAADERLAWLTGFTGSAGMAAATATAAAIFVDSRYTLQVTNQVKTDAFTPLRIPEDKVEDWLVANLKEGAKVGFDPWLHTPSEHARYLTALAAKSIQLVPTPNLVDKIWQDQPPLPQDPASAHPVNFAGEHHGDKCLRLAKDLANNDIAAAVLTVPESIAWLLNIRGSDVPNTPVVHASAILPASGKVRLFIDPNKVTPALISHFGDFVEVFDATSFEGALEALEGRVQADKASLPVAAKDALSNAQIVWKRDPCVLPRAIKNETELEGARRAGTRDATAVISFLAWLDQKNRGLKLTEITAAQKLEEFRRKTNALRDISFDTISGSGAHGAIVHYRVTTDTDTTLKDRDLYLVDSGGQYADGTTDITRTVAIGKPAASAVHAFTLVLKGMIGISNLRWPVGLSGKDIDAVARLALWQAGLDYGHGTGHGIGSYLGVHEGPQSLSRRSTEVLLPNMILSNEPGYYREGKFGIRIENLLVVRPAEVPKGGELPMHSFETLTYVPIDRRLIDASLLTEVELTWLNDYHAEVYARHADALDEDDQKWLAQATAPL